MLLNGYEIKSLIEGKVSCRFNEDESQCEYHPLVENLPENTEIKGAAIMLTLGSVQLNFGGSKITHNEMKAPLLKEIKPRFIHNEHVFLLEPNKPYIAFSNEEFNLPLDLVANVFTNSDLIDVGLIVDPVRLCPNYQGYVVMSIRNVTPEVIMIAQDTAIAGVEFARIGPITAAASSQTEPVTSDPEPAPITTE